MHLLFDELKGSYLELITTIVAGPASWSYFVPLLLLPLGLLVPPSVLSHGQLCAIILPISIAATIHAWTAAVGNDVISTDSLYLTLFLYFFKDPRKDFRHVNRSEHNVKAKKTDEKHPNGGSKDEAVVEANPVFLEAYPDSFSGRLTWAMMLPQSRPLHDWIIGETGHDRRVVLPFKHPTRVEFAMDVITRLLPVLVVFLPLSKQLARNDPYFSNPTWSIIGPYGLDNSGEGKTATLLKHLLPAVVLRPSTMAMYAYSLLLGLFLPPMLIVVLLNALRLIPDEWSPHTWRPHFGPFSAITSYGVRGFWGRWWHQQMRHIVAEPGRWFAGKLGLEDKGRQKTIKYMLICVSAFTLSGITHSGMVPPKPRLATVAPHELRMQLAGFFWLQPVGIAIEMFALEPILRRLPSSMRVLQAVLRVLWTAVFMCLACTFLVVPFGQLGYWNIVASEYLPHLL